MGVIKKQGVELRLWHYLLKLKIQYNFNVEVQLCSGGEIEEDF